MGHHLGEQVPDSARSTRRFDQRGERIGIRTGFCPTTVIFGITSRCRETSRVFRYRSYSKSSVTGALPIAVGGALLVIGIIVAVVIGLGIWVISTLARGGLIAGVNTIGDRGVSSQLPLAAGWAKGWRLLGISILPGIPGLILLLFALGVGGFSLGLTQLFDTNWAPFGAGAVAIIGGLICVVAPIAIALGLLRTFAERACMLEDLGVVDSYKRGWKVLTDNIGPAIVLFLIQIGITIVLGLVTIGPVVMMTLCCVLWPVLLLAQGAIAAYFSTLWTLAWREWTAPAESTAA